MGMFPSFFFHKFREVMSFTQIVRGRMKQDHHQRLKGVESALEILEDEKRAYEAEIREAKRDLQRLESENYNDDTVMGGRDISPI